MSHIVITFADGTKCYSGPSCTRHAGKTLLNATPKEQRIRAKLNDLYKNMNNPLEKQTPVNIDTSLSQIYESFYKIEDEILQKEYSIKKYEKLVNPAYSSFRQNTAVQYKEIIKRNQIEKDKLESEAKDILAEMEPFEKEFTRRGGWTRAFIVTNANGHVHKTMSCITCYPTTRFAWLPSYSGADEKKIVADAGKSACTECYPSAPVDILQRVSLIEVPDKKIARLKKEAAKAERDQKNKEKNIRNPDGTQIKLTGIYGNIVKSARTAENTAVDHAVTLLAAKNHKNNLWEGRKLEMENDYQILVSALAVKYGRSEKVQDDLIQDKANKKYEKEWK